MILSGPVWVNGPVAFSRRQRSEEMLGAVGCVFQNAGGSA